jgi:hypothetical protein
MTTGRRERDTETAAGFLEERADFLRVGVMSSGDGWDVVLRIDGTYSDRTLADDAREGMERWLRSVFKREGIQWIGWSPSGHASG